MRVLDEDAADDDARAAAVAHLDVCEACQQELTMLIETMNHVEAALDWIAANPDAKLDDDVT